MSQDSKNRPDGKDKDVRDIDRPSREGTKKVEERTWGGPPKPDRGSKPDKKESSPEPTPKDDSN